MNHFMSRAMATALLAASTFALAANGQAPSNTAPDKNPDLNKNQANQANDPTNQNKNQAPSDKAAAKAAERQADLDKKHAARDARKSGDKNSQDQKNAQDQSNHNTNAQTQLNPTTAPQQNSAVLPGEKSPRGSSNPQPPANLQGGNQPQNNHQTGRDQRDARRGFGSSTARERTALKPTDMRGPDIGLWFNRSNRDALVISDVSSHGPIARLGFREGDRIVSVNGHRVSGEPEFITYLLSGNEDRVAVIVTRDGHEQTIYVEPAQFTEEYGTTQVEPLEQFGVVLDDRYDDRIMVWRVIPRSPAYYAGIREGDVISTFGGRPYKTRTEFETNIRDMKAGEANLQVRRGEKTRDLSVDVPEFERSAQQGGERPGLGKDEQGNRDQGNRNSNDRGTDQNNNQQQGKPNSPNTGNGAPGGERRDSH
jgi:hypothetical protein